MVDNIENDQDREDERRRKGLLPFFFLIALIIVLILLLMNFYRGRSGEQVSTQRRSTIVVPNVVGMAENPAIARLKSAGFKVDVVTKAAVAGQIIGTVLSQVPAGGETLVRGSTVSITVAGPEISSAPGLFPPHEDPVTVPDVVGHPQSYAVDAIQAAGYDVEVSTLFSDVVPAGTVITQNPSGGTNLEAGGVVGIVVSAGKQAVKNVVVPNLIGLNRAEATAAVTSRGLTPYAVYGTDKSGSGGRVFSQWPKAGTVVAEGTQVTFQTGY